MLNIINARYGTPEEKPNDGEAMVQLVHEVMGAMTIYLNVECPEQEKARLWWKKRAEMRRMAEN